MKGNSAFSVAVLLLLLVVLSPSVRAETSVCEILARNLTPDVILQGSNSERFFQLKKLLSDNTYDNYGSASSSSIDGTALSAYVDIFLKTNSNTSNWHDHREQFLSMSYETAFSSDTSSLQIRRFNTAALAEIRKCQEVYANETGFSATLTDVSDPRNSFAVLLTYKTSGTPRWKLTNFSPQPQDSNFHCDNGYERASLTRPINLTTSSVLITCSKSPEAHLLLGVQTTAGPAKKSFTLESVHEEIQQIKEETAAKIQALTDRLDKRGEVVAFAAPSCPAPWTLYIPAVGRFVRGLDPAGTIDPDGTTRQAESLQADGIVSHVHTMGFNGYDTGANTPGTQRYPNFYVGDTAPNSKKQTDANAGGLTETRPKNVALLYCILN
jgi:hypothetical protein